MKKKEITEIINAHFEAREKKLLELQEAFESYLSTAIDDEMFEALLNKLVRSDE